MKAIEKFDITYNVKFSTYAVPLISGEIKRFLRDDGMIKVSRSLKELAYRAYTCQDKLRKKWGRDPTLLELARALEVEPEELTAALEATPMWSLCTNLFIRKTDMRLNLWTS